MSHQTILAVFLLFLAIVNSSHNIKGRILNLQPTGLDMMVQHFDQVLAYFYQGIVQATIEKEFNSLVANIRDTFPSDNTLFVLVNISDDHWNKTIKYGKNVQFKLIGKLNYYNLTYSDLGSMGTQLMNQYEAFIHPKLKVVYDQQLKDIDNTLVFKFNDSTCLDFFKGVYKTIYPYLQNFGLSAKAIPGKKAEIYLLSDNQSILYRNELNDTNEIIHFINIETLPLVTTLNDENYVRVFGGAVSDQMLFIYRASDKERPEIKSMRKIFELAARNNKQELKAHRIIFVEATVQEISKYFQDSVSSMENQHGFVYDFKIVFTKIDYRLFQLRKFTFPSHENKEPTLKNLLQFIQDVRIKNVDADYKSQKVPQTQGLLRKIVGKTFLEEIYGRKESVIVLFIDSKQKSSYSQILKTLEDFLKKYEDLLEGKVVAGIFDLEKNDHKLLSISTAPELVLFQRTNKKKPLTFKGVATVERIKNWLSYAAKDITIPENYGDKILPLGVGPQNSQGFTSEKGQL